MGRNKRNIVLENIELTDAGSLGKSISKKEGEKIIFTKNGVPGDIVDIRVRKKRKSYLEGDIIKYHKYSPKEQIQNAHILNFAEDAVGKTWIMKNN